MSIKNILGYTFTFGFVIIVIFLFMFKSSLHTNNSYVDENIVTDYTHEIAIGDTVVLVEFADTNVKQANGLSWRKPLKPNEGMLFIFENPDTYKFWMKDMNFAIDMIWLNEEQKIVFIKKNAEPSSYPELFGPKDDAKYVLEVVSGFSDKHNLKIGDFLEAQ